jgi:hypothetical protein
VSTKASCQVALDIATPPTNADCEQSTARPLKEPVKKSQAASWARIRSGAADSRRLGALDRNDPRVRPTLPTIGRPR